MVRNATALAFQRVGLLLIGVTFAAVVPTLMGPADYGRFALLLSVMTWFLILSDLGFPQALSRLVSERIGSDSSEKLKEFFGSALALRSLAGIVCALLFIATVSKFIGDLPRAMIALFAVVLALCAASESFYSWQLGANHAERWGSQFILRRVQCLIFVPVGYQLAHLPGAAAGIVLAELVVLWVGWRWTRDQFDAMCIRLRREVLRPLLQMGLLFYAGNLIGSTFRYSGEALVKFVTDDYVQVGFYGLSMSIYSAIEGGLVQLCVAAAPFLSRLQSEGRSPEIKKWLERLLCVLTALAMPAVFAAWFLAGDIAPRVLGEAFRPAVPNLHIVAVTLLAGLAHATSNMMALTLKRPRIYIVSSAVRLVVFVGAVLVLVPREGSYGACLSLLMATSASALVGLLQVRLQLPFSPRRWAQALGLAAPFLVLRGRGPDFAMFLLALAGYSAALFLTHTITRREISEAWRAMMTKEGQPI